jgi:hypothetical protein
MTHTRAPHGLETVTIEVHSDSRLRKQEMANLARSAKVARSGPHGLGRCAQGRFPREQKLLR